MTVTYSKVSMLLDSASEAVERARLRYRSSAITSHRLLGSLDLDELPRFVESGEWLTADAGDVIAVQGTPVEAVTFLGEGNAREEVASLGAGTYRAVVGFLGPGEDVGMLSLIDGAPHHSSVIAMRRVQALRVPLGEVERYLRSHPEWYRSMAEIAVARLRAHGMWLQAMV
jgi:CRP-like cAMP-binding protein